MHEGIEYRVYTPVLGLFLFSSLRQFAVEPWTLMGFEVRECPVILLGDQR